MIKVLNVIGSLNIGGAEANAFRTFKNIKHDRFDYSFLVFFEGDPQVEKEVNSLGGKIIRFSEPKRGYLQFLIQFNSLLKKGKFDVVHVNTLWNSGLIMFLAWLNHVPIRICHSHSTQSSAEETFKYKLYKLIMRKMIIVFSSHYVACGYDAGKYLFGRDLFEKKGEIIYNGVEIDEFKYNDKKREEVRKKFGINSECFVLGHIGRIAPVKNHPFILRLFKKLLENKYNVKLILVGDGPDLQKIKAYAKQNNLESNILFLGMRNDVNQIINAFDLFLFPSLYEGFPVSLIEVQANGLPSIVSTNVTSEAKILENQHYIPLSNYSKWFEIVAFFINNRVSRKDVDVSKVNSMFDITEITKKWEKIYEN